VFVNERFFALSRFYPLAAHAGLISSPLVGEDQGGGWAIRLVPGRLSVQGLRRDPPPNPPPQGGRASASKSATARKLCKLFTAPGLGRLLRVVFRSAKERPFAERKATLIFAQRLKLRSDSREEP